LRDRAGQAGDDHKSFEQYVSTRVGPGRINGGRAMLQRHAALLSLDRGAVRHAATDDGRGLGQSTYLISELTNLFSDFQHFHLTAG
jgi:hypothetical protein